MHAQSARSCKLISVRMRCQVHFHVQGLSTELGAFVAGVMMSATEQQENTLHQLEPLKQFFLSLFICSTGLIMSPKFLAQHLRVLAGGLVVTVLSKTVLVSKFYVLRSDCGSADMVHAPLSRVSVTLQDLW